MTYPLTSASNTLDLRATSDSNTWTTASVSSSPASVTLGGATSTHWVSVGSGAPVTELRDKLAALIVAVKAGASCRCYATAVCPDCDTLNKALAAAEETLNPPVYMTTTPTLPVTYSVDGTPRSVDSNTYTGVVSVSTGITLKPEFFNLCALPTE